MIVHDIVTVVLVCDIDGHSVKCCKETLVLSTTCDATVALG